jgi:hypothetical protein
MKLLVIGGIAAAIFAFFVLKRRSRESLPKRYRKEMAHGLKDLDKRTRNLRRRARQVRGEARERLQQQMHDLEGRQQELRERLDDLRGEASRLLERARQGS